MVNDAADRKVAGRKGKLETQLIALAAGRELGNAEDPSHLVQASSGTEG
jgi:hypothetical protein